MPRWPVSYDVEAVLLTREIEPEHGIRRWHVLTAGDAPVQLTGHADGGPVRTWALREDTSYDLEHDIEGCGGGEQGWTARGSAAAARARGTPRRHRRGRRRTGRRLQPRPDSRCTPRLVPHVRRLGQGSSQDGRGGCCEQLLAAAWPRVPGPSGVASRAYRVLDRDNDRSGGVSGLDLVDRRSRGADVSGDHRQATAAAGHVLPAGRRQQGPMDAETRP